MSFTINESKVEELLKSSNKGYEISTSSVGFGSDKLCAVLRGFWDQLRTTQPRDRRGERASYDASPHHREIRDSAERYRRVRSRN